jgi:hypothetical protein
MLNRSFIDFLLFCRVSPGHLAKVRKGKTGVWPIGRPSRVVRGLPFWGSCVKSAADGSMVRFLLLTTPFGTRETASDSRVINSVESAGMPRCIRISSRWWMLKKTELSYLSQFRRHLPLGPRQLLDEIRAGPDTAACDILLGTYCDAPDEPNRIQRPASIRRRSQSMKFELTRRGSLLLD